MNRWSPAVTRAWRRVLGRRGLAEDMPFAEAGGDSLRLLQFVFELEAETGLELPLDVFCDSLRPSEFAAALESAGVVAGLIDDGRPVVWLMPGMGDDEPRLVQFRRSCPGVRFRVVAYPDWADMVRPGFTFDTLIARVVEQISGERVLLLGYSFGAVVAAGATFALRASGRRVAFLGILDHPLEWQARRPLFPPARMWAMIRARAVGGSSIDTAAETLAHHLVDRPAFRPLLRIAARVLPAHVPVGTNRHLSRLAFAMKRNLRMSFQRALGRAWRPDGALSGVDVTLFRGAGHDGLPRDLGWTRLCPRLTCVDIPGAHHEMFEPANLPVLCTAFEAAVTRVTVPAWSERA